MNQKEFDRVRHLDDRIKELEDFINKVNSSVFMVIKKEVLGLDLNKLLGGVEIKISPLMKTIIKESVEKEIELLKKERGF